MVGTPLTIEQVDALASAAIQLWAVAFGVRFIISFLSKHS